MRIWYQSGVSFEQAASYAKYLKEHAQAAADPGTQVEVFGTAHGGAGFEYRFMEFLFTRDIVDGALKAEHQGYDGFIIGCTHDAGLLPVREVLNIPAIGITEAALLTACIMGRNFSLITPNEKMIPRFDEVVKQYGLKERLVSIQNMDFKISELDRVFGDKKLQEKQLREFTDGARKTIEAGSEVIIPIGGMASLFLARAGLHQIDGVPVIDTISNAVKMTEMVVKLGKITGTFVSRRRSFAKPPEAMLKQAISDFGIDIG